jgi:penicillin-binding protein 1A
MTVNRRRAWLSLAWAIIIALTVTTGFVVHRLWELRGDIEHLASRLVLDIGPESTLIFDGRDRLISALFEEHRIAVRLEDISPHVVRAVLATEDKRFHDHPGIDVRRVIMAAIANYRAGHIVQGGSTISQQLVRSIILNREKSYARKIKEALLAFRLEERYSKTQILEAYLNRVYFGDGYYGIEAAALGYFGKPAARLDAVESALLAGLIKGPSLYSPTRAPELARLRRDLVLGEMREDGMLSEADYSHAIARPVPTLLAKPNRGARTDLRHVRGGEYFRDAVARELIQRFGEEAVYTGGLRVYTTLDQNLQALAETSMIERLNRVPRGQDEPMQGALVAIEPETGHVRAIVGGRDFYESPFNRAVDAKRQPGSAFKPFIFAMALESGYAPSTLLENLDEPIATPQGPWLPGGEHETTAVRLRDALVVSSNRAAAHLMRTVGIARTVDLVHRFGVRSNLPHVPSLALGTGEMSLFELTSAYTVFANRGVWREPIMIRKVLDREGNEIYRAPQTERSVITEATAYLMSSMMADVINRGTAHAVRRHGFRHAAAGKTGTSQAYADAWFVGYTRRLVTGVWFGYDKPQTIMKRGFASVVAVPAWARFMAAAHKGVKNDWFDMPGSVKPVKLCRLSGQLATDRCRLPVIEPPRYEESDPILALSATIREGGVYDELRHVSRTPEPCTLPHRDGNLHLETAIEADVRSARTTGDVPPASIGIIRSGMPTAVPSSMRPPRPAPVITLEPGATLPRPVALITPPPPPVE